MRKWIFLTAVVLLLSMLTPAAYGANTTIRPDETAYVTISIDGTYEADSIAVTFSYDKTLLEPVYSSCTWARQGTLQDFGTHRDSGVWAVLEPTELGGEICTLAFRVCPGKESFAAKVECRVILKNDEEFVADQTVEATITVREAPKPTQAPTTKPQADDHDHDHDHDHDTDPGSVITAKERTRNMVVFFGTVAVLGVAAVLLRKKKRRR